MLTKVKRMRLNKMRQKFAVGDEARKFENIPTASQPQQQKVGTRDNLYDKYVTEQVKSPELASAATQQYTTQAVQADELLAGTYSRCSYRCRYYKLLQVHQRAPTLAYLNKLQLLVHLTAAQ